MPPNKNPYTTNICDYEGSNYRTDFWEGQGREYEDRVERIALRRMLPAQGGVRMLEVGGGFGRLTNEYASYKQVVLLDYSLSQLQYAQENFGKSDHYVYVAADAYKLPFQAGVFDGASMVRVIHHMSDVPTALSEVRRVLAPNGVFILEHANKQNIKAMLRYALKQQAWSPYDYKPVEFVELNFDFHPAYMLEALKTAQFEIKQRIPVSFFRVELLKKLAPVNILASLDSMLQYTGLMYTPSIFVKAIAQGSTPTHLDLTDVDSLFVCPETGAPLKRDGNILTCTQSGLRYAVRDGIYDFKAPLD